MESDQVESRPVTIGVATCNQGHRRIDPWGFGLENFDPIGNWRTHYGRSEEGAAIDAADTLPNGDSFQGLKGIEKMLLNKKTSPTKVEMRVLARMRNVNFSRL